MNKFIFTLFIFILNANSGYGQLSSGLSSGLNIAQYQNSTEFKQRLGFFAEATLRTHLSKNNFLNLGIQYSQDSFDDESIDYPTRVDYFRLTPQYEFQYFPLEFLIGINCGYKINEKIKKDGDNWSLAGKDEHITDFDIGLTFIVRLIHQGFYIAVTSYYGINDVSLYHYPFFRGETGRINNKNVKIGLGYFINRKDNKEK